MKNLIIFCFVLINYNNYAQITSTVPLSQVPILEPNGIYIKDIFNDFSPYIGIWQAIWQGKTFKLIIAKESQVLKTFQNGEYYYRDYLYGNYIITNNITGAELENTTALTDFNFQKIKSAGRPKNNKLSFLYLYRNLCSVAANLYLKTNPNNPNELKYGFFYDDWWLPMDCEYSSYDQIPIPIPKVVMTLTRVN